MRTVPKGLAILFASVSATLAASNVTTGTGFLVSNQGHVVTNHHVVEGCRVVLARSGSAPLHPVELLATDPKNDLAVLKINPLGLAKPLMIRRSRPRLAESVIAMGFPLAGISASSVQATVGNISALAGVLDDTRALQFTAPIQPGNSGGPLIDSWGDVVGVVTSRLSSVWSIKNIGDLPQNVNFAMKASMVAAFLDSNSIPYETAPTRSSVPAAEDVAEMLAQSVFLIQCDSATPETSSPASSSSPPLSSPRQPVVKGGLYVTGYGRTEYLQQVYLDLTQALIADGVSVVEHRNVQTGAELNTVAGIIESARSAGADGVLYFSLSIAFGGIDRLKVQCFDAEGNPLWQEETTSMWQSSSQGAVNAVTKRMREKLKARIQKNQVPGRKAR